MGYKKCICGKLYPDNGQEICPKCQWALKPISWVLKLVVILFFSLIVSLIVVGYLEEKRMLSEETGNILFVTILILLIVLIFIVKLHIPEEMRHPSTRLKGKIPWWDFFSEEAYQEGKRKVMEDKRKYLGKRR